MSPPVAASRRATDPADRTFCEDVRVGLTEIRGELVRLADGMSVINARLEKGDDRFADMEKAAERHGEVDLLTFTKQSDRIASLERDRDVVRGQAKAIRWLVGLVGAGIVGGCGFALWLANALNLKLVVGG